MPKQMKFFPWLLVVLSVVVIVVGYLILNKVAVFWPAQSPYDKVFRSKPQPVSIRPVIDEEVKNEKTIEPNGGYIEVLAGGQKVSLEIPAGSLFSPEEVSIQTIKTINNLPEGTQFITGVKLEPDGLGLVKPATLIIHIPPSVNRDDLVAFAYEADGSFFHFLPSFGDGNSVEIPMTGFSGGGIIDVPGLIPVINPGTPEQTAKQLLADVLRRGAKKQERELKQGERKDLDPRLLAEAQGILNAWYRAGVMADLKIAQTDDAQVDGALKQMITWRVYVEVFGLEPHFQKEYEESLNSAARAIKHAVYQADKRCSNQKDPSQIAALLRWLKLAKELGLAGRAGLSEEEIQKKAKNCVVFEIHMESLFTFPALTFKLPAKLDGVLELSDDFLRLTGNGTIKEGPFTYSTGMGGGCHQDAISYNFTIPDTKFNINLHKKSSAKVDLTLDLSAGGDVRLNCSGYTGPALNIPVPWSNDYFPGFHEDELVSGTKSTYHLKNWQIVGTKDIFSQKVYKRSLQGATEDTIFILKHTPRQ